MQLKFQREKSIGQSIGRTLIKIFIALIILLAAIFFLDKINFSSPKKISKKTSQMKLLSLNKFLFIFLFFIIILSPRLKSEDTVDIWKKKENSENNFKISENKKEENKNQINFKKKNVDSNIEISEEFEFTQKEKDLYGIYDPEDLDLNLNMWVKSDGNDIKKLLKELKN